MARLVDDLLSLSRIEQNQYCTCPEKLRSISVLVARHVADTLAPLAEEMGVDLKIDAGQPVIVAGDRDELVRVAENLIENAIKYGASSDRVQRRSRRGRGDEDSARGLAQRARPWPRDCAGTFAAAHRTVLSH